MGTLDKDKRKKSLKILDGTPALHYHPIYTPAKLIVEQYSPSVFNIHSNYCTAARGQVQPQRLSTQSLESFAFPQPKCPPYKRNLPPSKEHPSQLIIEVHLFCARVDFPLYFCFVVIFDQFQIMGKLSQNCLLGKVDQAVLQMKGLLLKFFFSEPTLIVLAAASQLFAFKRETVFVLSELLNVVGRRNYDSVCENQAFSSNQPFYLCDFVECFGVVRDQFVLALNLRDQSLLDLL